MISTLISGQQWALLKDNKLVNRHFCSTNGKWQYEDNFFQLPDQDNDDGDYIIEISKPDVGK